MILDDIKIVTRLLPWSGSIELLGMVNGSHAIVPVTIEKATEGEIIRPFIVLQFHQAQTLMDSLWDCGLRPSEGSGSAGAMAAVQEHLKDMRRLVFAKQGEQ